MIYKILVVVFMLIGMNACQQTKLHIPEFDAKGWKLDPYGCKNHRLKLVKKLISKKRYLLNRDDAEIVEFLGKPERTELYTKNQKFYFYYISPGANCEKGDSTTGKQFYIRLSALGKVTDINYHF